MEELTDPQWYFDNVLAYAVPGDGGRIVLGPAARWRRWWETQAAGGASEATLLAASQGFVAGVDQLSALGWRRHDDRREQRRGAWSSVGYGARTPVDTTCADAHLARRRTHALTAAAAALARSSHRVSARSAAILHGLPTLDVPRRPELTADATLGRRSRVHVFGASLAGDRGDSWFGVPVTGVARTLVDLARHDPRDAIMAADAALRDKLVTTAEITAQLDLAAGWPGVRRAREVLVLADPRAESPLESLLRLAMHHEGLPAPVPQARIDDHEEGRSYRVDLLIEDARLVLEADRRGKYSGEELWREKRREARLSALGYQVARVLWTDVLDDWPATCTRLRRQLRAHQLLLPR